MDVFFSFQQRVHPNKLKLYTDCIENSRKRNSSPAPTDEPHLKNAKISAFSMSVPRVRQATFDKALLNFICEGGQPFSVVKLPSFKSMVQTLQPHCTIMSRKTVVLKIQEAAKIKQSLIIKKLSSVSHVATTTDCWTARQRSYLGVTCHWIDRTSLARCSAVLACRRMKGSHTFDVLAAALEEIHSEYQIREKVTRTTTDSGSNFLKAFRVYSKSDEEATDEQEENAPDDEGPLEEVEYQDVSAILNDDTGLEYQLPRHHRCACHLLNLVSTTDASAAEVGCETYKRLSRSAFAKCQALWNKTSRSTIAFETVERECRLQFLRPNDTRWSSLYLAVERVVQIHKEKGESAIRNVCTAKNIKM